MYFEQHRRADGLTCACLAVLATVGYQASGQDWPTFRGSNRTAVAGDSGLLNQWDASGPRLLWTAKGAGSGYSSAAVAAGRVYTLGDAPSTAADEDEYLTCYDLSSGKQLWMTKTGPAWNGHPSQPTWNGARSTPTIDGDHVYVLNPNGMLHCVSIHGQPIWNKSLPDDLSGKKHDGWGYGESPLIDGNLLICTPGGEKATVVALDKVSGEVVWTCARPNDVGAGHSSVVTSNVGGRKVYVQNTGGGPLGIDAATGALLWSYDVPPPVAFIPSPVIKDDLVFTVAGYGTGGALLRQVPGDGGRVTIKEVYGLNKDLDNKHGGVILVGNHLYAGCSDRSQIYCAELETGKIVWRGRGSGSGSTSVIAADGKLFIRYQNGKVGLAPVSTESFDEVSSFQTPGSGDGKPPSWAHPVIAHGKLLLRENDTILCYDIKR
ncbi:MAG: PQQ-like beta-propeller repeat protein [Pirellulaceae bacterium]|nr:PQQ-like beta-propeller repeat protein [Pirellulaceae bacterium]